MLLTIKVVSIGHNCFYGIAFVFNNAETTQYTMCYFGFLILSRHFFDCNTFSYIRREIVHETYFISRTDEREQFGKMHTHKIDCIKNLFHKNCWILRIQYYPARKVDINFLTFFKQIFCVQV